MGRGYCVCGAFGLHSPVPFYCDSPNSLLLGWRYITNLLCAVLFHEYKYDNKFHQQYTIVYCCWLNTT